MAALKDGRLLLVLLSIARKVTPAIMSCWLETFQRYIGEKCQLPKTT
jgi:hypothetical protein